jgi:hypothetical protein
MIRIGTRDSALAVWQAKLVKDLLEKQGIPAQLVYIKTEGDQDGVTPLYAMGVEGVFTRTLDAALLSGRVFGLCGAASRACSCATAVLSLACSSAWAGPVWVRVRSASTRM